MGEGDVTQLALAGHEMPIAHGDDDWWPTPPWLAERIVAWANPGPGDSILEPSAGDGALVRAIRALDARRCGAHEWTRITAVELRPEREPWLRAADADDVVIGDWPTVAAAWAMRDRPSFDLAISNPPFSLIAQHLYPMVAVARRAVVLLPLTALEGQERHREVWSRVVLERLAILVSRPRFGGHTSPATAYCVVEIRRRRPGEQGGESAARVEWW